MWVKYRRAGTPGVAQRRDLDSQLESNPETTLRLIHGRPQATYALPRIHKLQQQEFHEVGIVTIMGSYTQLKPAMCVSNPRGIG